MADPEPFVTRISSTRGSRKRLIFVSGFHTSDYRPEKLGQWVRAFRGAGWRGSVHWLWWDSCCTHERFAALWDALEWAKANRMADRAGRMLPQLLQGFGGSGGITLLGHSLGAKLIFTGLLSLDADHGLPLEDAVFLAGAVHADREEDWATAASRLSGTLVNVVNERDGALGTRYYVGELLRLSPGKAAGRTGVEPEAAPGRLVNLDVTDLLDTDSHTAVYRTRLDEILGRLWDSQRRRARLLSWGMAAALAAAALIVLL